MLRFHNRSHHTSTRLLLFHGHSLRHVSSKTFDPLRILFCGSDEFSITSLQALVQEKKVHPRSIASIDVVCRPGKAVRRNLKAFREGSLSDKLPK